MKDEYRIPGARYGLLGVEDIFEYLGLGPVIAYRWKIS
jgi:hypothetical protein